jgi:predicted transcriptional regulator
MHLPKGTRMSKEQFRTHIVLPREVVDEVDRLVGHRRRSQFMTEAVREKLRREKLAAALAVTAGVLKDADLPHWATPEATSAWVRELRQEDDAATAEKLRAWEAE